MGMGYYILTYWPRLCAKIYKVEETEGGTDPNS